MIEKDAPETIEVNGVWYDRRDTVEALNGLLIEARRKIETYRGIIRDYRRRDLETNPTPATTTQMNKAPPSYGVMVKTLKDIAEFSSGDATTMGALRRLASIRNTALDVLGVVGSPDLKS